MNLLAHLNLYYGYEAENMKEFIKDFKEEFEDDDDAATSLLMFLNSVSRFL